MAINRLRTKLGDDPRLPATSRRSAVSGYRFARA